MMRHEETEKIKKKISLKSNGFKFKRENTRKKKKRNEDSRAYVYAIERRHCKKKSKTMNKCIHDYMHFFSVATCNGWRVIR